ncbi:conserved hypothetical protein [Methanococcus maripaludis C5]|uniref:Uncharacterized protein n=1 Tax=Methanococcus maripaludis (strain C5 / ATCC BAA-1333) TaxID=402880 RepID=A4G0W9_METM5|nr:hypothetical protein [Methanococcus maripaludis]ABO36103.1 conserved hypothetical protein [Methanococcus maripaludis C5]
MLNFEIIRKDEIIANGNYVDDIGPNGKIFIIPKNLEEGMKITAFLNEISKKIHKIKSKNEFSDIVVGEYSLKFE